MLGHDTSALSSPEETWGSKASSASKRLTPEEHQRRVGASCERVCHRPLALSGQNLSEKRKNSEKRPCKKNAVGKIKAGTSPLFIPSERRFFTQILPPSRALRHLQRHTHDTLKYRYLEPIHPPPSTPASGRRSRSSKYRNGSSSQARIVLANTIVWNPSTSRWSKVACSRSTFPGTT